MADDLGGVDHDVKARWRRWSCRRCGVRLSLSTFDILNLADFCVRCEDMRGGLSIVGDAHGLLTLVFEA